jgi:hypothetical protein
MVNEIETGRDAELSVTPEGTDNDGTSWYKTVRRRKHE